MTTFTLTVDERTTSLIRRVAAQEHKDETLAATQLLEWAARHDSTNNTVTEENGGDGDTVSLAHSQQQIKQIFERNEW